MNKNIRVGSIDVLRGIVMIIMTLDHVRDYFHFDAFHYDPTDLSRTNGFLFFTRYITHFCAPVFVFLAGISARMYGLKRSKGEVAYYLFTRGLWLVVAEIFIITLGWTFNPEYPLIILQVIWAIGASMIALSALVYLQRKYLLVLALLLIGAHNSLDGLHVSGPAGFFWSLLHVPGEFRFEGMHVVIRYPLIPWIGIIALGYWFGDIVARKHKSVLLFTGIGAIVLFIVLRFINLYGDHSHWTVQNDSLFTFLSFLNVTKYPPSLLYTLMTLGPAMIFLALAERPLNTVTARLAVFGRVPFFYYVIHIYLIHLLAAQAAVVLGYNWSDMVLSDRVNRIPRLKGYGFSLSTVYLVWIALVVLLYPWCKWFDEYKRTHQSTKRWLKYL